MDQIGGCGVDGGSRRGRGIMSQGGEEGKRGGSICLYHASDPPLRGTVTGAIPQGKFDTDEKITGKV